MINWKDSFLSSFFTFFSLRSTVSERGGNGYEYFLSKSFRLLGACSLLGVGHPYRNRFVIKTFGLNFRELFVGTFSRRR
ncbi:hypothetical protein F8M41_003952 [Gigaspora margarita]|uniref:Uncharacterized protein n=1 Tax=Gigaspora margarita TaxID=4874 RepID=A0A8H4A7B3_GIGMA|nr:hypothetical protein F8M41_003952 [Gigaspora margarita]